MATWRICVYYSSSLLPMYIASPLTMDVVLSLSNMATINKPLGSTKRGKHSRQTIKLSEDCSARTSSWLNQNSEPITRGHFHERPDHQRSVIQGFWLADMLDSANQKVAIAIRVDRIRFVETSPGCPSRTIDMATALWCSRLPVVGQMH